MKIDDSIRAKYYGGYNNKIEYIVLHYTANSGTNATAKGNANYFANPKYEASAHFVVDSGDTIYQCVPENHAAWAIGGYKYPYTIGATFYNICTNYNSLSIEMVSCTDKNGAYYIPGKTIDHAVELTKQLMKKYGVDANHVIRHYDVTGKPCPWCWTNVDPYSGDDLWKAFKARLSNSTPQPSESFQVKILVDLNIREDAGVEFPIINTIYDRYRYTIINTKKALDGGTWGNLKSGGWINISPKFVQRI